MYRTIDTATWDDPWVTDLAPPDKLLFFYLLTNRRSTACGAFEITLKAMAFETGMSAQQVKAALPRLQPKIVWWADHQVIFVRNFYKHQRAQSNKDNFRAAAIKKLEDFHCDVQQEVWACYPELRTLDDGLPTYIKAEVSHTHPIPMGPPSLGDKETVTVTVTEEETVGRPRTKVARPFPPDFSISDDMKTWAKKNVPDLDILAATEQWSDAMRSNTTKYKYTDWEAAWRTGMKRALEWGHGGTNGYKANGRLGGSEQSGPRQLEVPKAAGPGKSFGRSLEAMGHKAG